MRRRIRTSATTVTHSRQPPVTPRAYRVQEASRNPHIVMHEMLREYGDFLCWRGFGDMWLVNHPDLIRPVLTRDHRHFSKDLMQTRMLRQILGNGLLTSEGSDWVRQRKRTQPAFAANRIARFDSMINARTSSLLDRWAVPGTTEVLRVDREMTSLTFRIVCETLFGRDVEEHVDEMAELREVLDRPTYNMRAFQVLSPGSSGARELEQALERLDRIVYGLIGERERSGGGGGSDNVLDRLLAARDEETGEGMDDRQLRDEIVTLMLAGHDTAAMALSWTLYLLATHPEVDERLCGHLEANLHGGPARTEDLERLPYLKQVAQEAMRLYPPIWSFARRAEREAELGGYVVPEKAWVGIVTWALHRHPEFWPDPERFDPDRFEPDRARDRDPFAYLPFAAGPRGCMGAGMAMIEIPLILAQVVQRFRMSVVPGHPIETEARMTLTPRHGIPVTLRRR